MKKKTYSLGFSEIIIIILVLYCTYTANSKQYRKLHQVVIIGIRGKTCPAEQTSTVRMP